MLLREAMKAIPMVVDSDPVDVAYECEDFVAVNKPVGVQTAPVHRWKGGSMVNRLLGHLKGGEPLTLHRLDMNTSGVLLFAKKPAVVPGVHRQFR